MLARVVTSQNDHTVNTRTILQQALLPGVTLLVTLPGSVLDRALQRARLSCRADVP